MRPAPLTAALVLAGALALAGALPGPGAPPRAAAQPSAEETTPQTDASIPARGVTMIGATPEEPEAPGSDKTWGVGHEGATSVLVRYTSSTGWSLGPALPSGFKPEESPLAGQMTPRGTGVLAGTVPGGESGPRQVLLVRGDGGAFAETTRVPAEGETLAAGEEPLLKKGEELFGGARRAPLIVPLDEAGGGAGALVAPVDLGSGIEHQVLHWDGGKWTRESIAIPAKSEADFRVLAIAASSPRNAWLLGQLSSSSSYSPGAVALFRRIEESGQWRWKPVALAAGSGDGEAHPLTVPLENGEAKPFTVAGAGEPPNVRAQLLTLTSEGVWVDGERADIHARTPDSTTLFFKPEGSAGGQIEASWCVRPPEGAAPCQHELPATLPGAFGRSFAWADGSRFGERVITGLSGGVSLRLEGEVFKPVLALGAGSNPEETPGALFGAAFSSPTEGWLGMAGLPVHMTTSLTASRLTPWPAPFRQPLLAIVPEPGTPVGSLSSEALAVGDLGAVARYKPGEGWLPESLFGPGGKVKTPRLRAVAWPTPTRAYAVGDEEREGGGEQMWLWRGETGLWERDPATPLNFRGNLLGIAFDPNNPTRGYAIGSSTTAGTAGVLLRYGKTWTQETALPSQVRGATFVAIAFAGSEAIVAYREQPNPAINSFVGGLLLNEGAGWRVDEGAASLIGSAMPVAVAGLPDGGAAFATTGSEGPRVYEREATGSPWKATPTPLPGVTTGSLALFREGGALRAVVSGGGGVGTQAEGQLPPPGFPPYLLPPLSLRTGLESGGVLRQTASGWSDEGHELNPVGTPAGGYVRQDLPNTPDSIFAILIDPSGQLGWAVGGILSSEKRVETGDVERYPADGVKPTGESEATVSLQPGDATFAIGGHAECAAPCAERARAGVGPQVWLSSAVALARRIGVRAFLYTGPSVTEGIVGGLRSVAIPFQRELETTASILAATGPLPVYVAPSPPDLNARPEHEGTEATFAQAFAGFPQAALEPAERSPEQCSATVGCQTAYYSFLSEGAGGTVRVIVLDDTGDVNSTQLHWLEGWLTKARETGTPAIVAGADDINAQISVGDGQAAAVAKALVCDGASAYFYDSPEEDVKKPLRAVCGTTSESIETFGSGTLGYVQVFHEQQGNFHGASGILLGQVDVAARNAATNRAPVTVRLIPVIGELAQEAKDGTLLRRSEPALFDALARQPRAGGVANPNSTESEIDPYIPIPEECVGKECSSGLFPEYTFTSSNPEIGAFVKHNTEAANNPHAVLQNAKGEPINDEPKAGQPAPEESGLFCSFNPGTTIVTISAGGLSASLPVTVQAGSVRQPCGTVPLKHLPAVSQITSAPVPPPAPAPAPAGPAPASAPPPVPLPPPPAAIPPAPARQAPRTPPPFFLPPALAAPVLAFVPPPVPTPARPTPPSGTSAVTSPIEVAEHEEEEESATESVSNQALAYRASEHEPSPAYLLGIVLLAAFAGASIRRRPRRGRREVSVAPATLTSMRSQRQMAARSRRAG